MKILSKISLVSIAAALSFLTGCDSDCCMKVLHPPVAKILGIPSGTLDGTTLDVQGNGSTDSDGNVVSYLWKIDGESVSQEPNPTLTFDSAGEHEVCLTVTDNDGKSDTTCQKVIVPEPQGPTSVITGLEGKTLKTDCPIRISGTSSYTGDCQITEFAWTRDAQTTPFATGSVISLSFNTTGSHRICLTTRCDNGLSDTKCENVTVHPHTPPTPILTVHKHSDTTDLTNHNGDDTTILVKMVEDSFVTGTGYQFKKGDYYDFNCSLSHDDCNDTNVTCSWLAKSYRSDGSAYINNCFTTAQGHSGATSENGKVATTVICSGAAYFDLNLTVTDRFGNSSSILQRFNTTD